MISLTKEYCKSVIRRFLPNKRILKIEEYDVSHYSEDLGTGDQEIYYVGKFSTSLPLNYYRTFDDISLGHVIQLPVSNDDMSLDYIVFNRVIFGGGGSGFSFVGYKITLSEEVRVRGVISVPGTTDRNIDGYDILDYTGNPSTAAFFQNLDSVSIGDTINPGQSGGHDIPTGKFQVKLRCGSGIKAAHFQITTKQGVFSSDQIINDTMMVIENVCFSDGWTIEIIDDTL
jgi:hypothetical protein